MFGSVDKTCLARWTPFLASRTEPQGNSQMPHVMWKLFTSNTETSCKFVNNIRTDSQLPQWVQVGPCHKTLLKHY